MSEELPEGWSCVQFGRLLADSQNGCSARAGKGAPTVVLRLADVSTAGAVSDSGLREIPLSAEDRDKYALQLDDLLAFRVNGSPSIAGRVIRYPGPPGHAYCDHFIRFRVTPGCASPSFVALAFQARQVREQVESQMVSSAGQNTVSQATYRQVELPLPPLAEQHRIVAKVEALLAEVNAARERLAKVPAILKRFRQAVLAAACSGRLTVEWRETHQSRPVDAPPNQVGTDDLDNSDVFSPELPIGWAWVALDDACESVIDYRGRTPPVDDGGTIPHVRTTNIRGARIDWKTDSFVSPSTYDQYMTRGIPRRGDVIFTMEAPLGEAAVVDRDDRFSLAQRLLLLRGKKDLLHGTYLALALHASSVRRAIEQRATGTTVLGIAYKRFKFVRLPVPPVAEQEEIAKRTETLLAVADTIEKHVAAATARADKVTQAVLAKAFRGELVPTEAELAREEGRDYEPASVLLERVKSERSEVPTRRRKTGTSEGTGRLGRRPANARERR